MLGAMMLSESAIEAASNIIDAGDFYRESHAKIYRAALELYQQGQPVDAITVADKLDEKGELDEIGGKDRIHEIATLVPATSNAGHYARIVREMATLRGLTVVGRADPAPRLGAPGRDAGARRPGRADGVRPRPAPDPRQLRARRRARAPELRADHEDVRVGRRDDRHADGLPRHRPDDVGPAAGQPRSSSPAARAWASPRSRWAWPRTSALQHGHPRRRLHARDVEARGRAAAHVLRGAASSCSASAPAGSRTTTGRAS